VKAVCKHRQIYQTVVTEIVDGQWPALSALIGGSIQNKLIEQQFAEVLRLAVSIQQGTVKASPDSAEAGSLPPAKQPCSGPARNRQDRAHAVYASYS
jgi:hypothetical protein